MSLSDNLPRPPSGGVITGEYLRSISDRQTRISRDARMQSVGQDAPMVQVPLKRYVVKSVSDDHLVCRTWDGVTEGAADVKVAKPFILRKTPFHGKTLTVNGNTLTYSYTSGTQRTVTKGSNSETQVIIPGYVATGSGYQGNQIYVIRCDSGVILNPGQQTEERLTLMDVNADGRMWAKQ